MKNTQLSYLIFCCLTTMTVGELVKKLVMSCDGWRRILSKKPDMVGPWHLQFMSSHDLQQSKLTLRLLQAEQFICVQLWGTFPSHGANINQMIGPNVHSTNQLLVIDYLVALGYLVARKAYTNWSLGEFPWPCESWLLWLHSGFLQIIQVNSHLFKSSV